MTPIERIDALAQSIFLARNGRYNDVDGEELVEFRKQTIDWVNQFTPELELEAEWNYLRTNANLIETIADTTIQVFPLPQGIRSAVVSPYRDATISYDGAIVSTFTMVSPDQISDPTNPDIDDRATVINGQLILSRPPKEMEVGGELRVDTISHMPELTESDISVLDLVKPKQLIILGVAKNATLPDIVQGGISPSLTQKYGDLLEKAVAENNRSAGAMSMPGEDFSGIRGVW